MNQSSVLNRMRAWLCKRGYHHKITLPAQVNMSRCWWCGAIMKTDNSKPCEYRTDR